MSEGYRYHPKSFEGIDGQPSIEAISHPDLVVKYALFRDTLNPKAGVIYHPCGANDISPSSAFPNSRVIYVDIDENAMTSLKEKGFDAHIASALEFNPGDVDVLIMLNPTISSDIPSSYVVQDGFALSNDYHGTATSLQQNPKFELRAMIRKSPTGELLFDTDNLEDYWREIDTEEEFKNAPFDWGSANYAMALPVVRTVTGKEENVLAEYKKIIELAREQGGIMDDMFVYNFNEMQLVGHTTFPKKKGTVDDIFVFQKIQSETTEE